MSSGAPRGQGQVVRLSRGASLSDFADKINANPGSLVQVAFTELGEMVTATQSCTDETLMLLAVHLGYDVVIVSPEEEDAELLDRFDLTFGGDYDEEREHELIDAFALDPSKRIRKYSKGNRQKVMLVAAFAARTATSLA